MKQLKHYGRLFLIFVISMILYAFLLGVINFFKAFEGSITSILLFLYMIIITFYMGYTSGKLAEKNGYLEGLKVGGILILLLILFNIIFFQSPFSLTRVFYYLILLAVSVASSVLGINKKKQK